MALKLFRRKSKAPKEPKQEELKETKPMEEKIPVDDVKVERVAMPPVDKQETIDEETDVATVESAADEPVQEEAENSDPTAEQSDEPAESAKEMETSEEDVKEQSSTFACCQGSSADVLKNLQAAVGMA